MINPTFKISLLLLLLIHTFKILLLLLLSLIQTFEILLLLLLLI